MKAMNCMRKSFLWLLILLLAVNLAGCSKGQTLPVENLNWTMTSVQSSEDGKILFCAPERQEQTPEASVKILRCTLDGEKVVVTDEETGEKWTGAYERIRANPDQSAIYEVTFDSGEMGYMTSGITTYSDGSQSGTLILTHGDYTANFSADLAVD